MDSQLWERVVEIQREFVYENTIRAVNGYDVYYCHKPDTCIYSFEMVCTPRAIYIHGDIDCLVWNVGRDISFLSGDDIDYYIHSKLTHDFRSQRDFDEEGLKEHLQDLVNEKELSHTDMNLLLSDLKGETSLDVVYETIHRYNCGIVEDVDFYHIISKPSESIMFRLYMSCYAARQIVKQREVNKVREAICSCNKCGNPLKNGELVLCNSCSVEFYSNAYKKENI